MTRSIILTAVAGALACIAVAAWAQERERPADKNTGSIKAEVRGILRFEAGHGYFIFVKSAEKPEREYHVWLWISEDKAMVAQLQLLMGKEVLAQGNLEQMPEAVHTSVPPNGMYLHRFEINGIDVK